jgi:hypothetical protein
LYEWAMRRVNGLSVGRSYGSLASSTDQRTPLPHSDILTSRILYPKQSTEVEMNPMLKPIRGSWLPRAREVAVTARDFSGRGAGTAM